MASRVSMNPANFVRIFSLDADFRALDWPASNTFDDIAEGRLSRGVGLEH